MIICSLRMSSSKIGVSSLYWAYHNSGKDLTCPSDFNNKCRSHSTVCSCALVVEMELSMVLNEHISHVDSKISDKIDKA